MRFSPPIAITKKAMRTHSHMCANKHDCFRSCCAFTCGDTEVWSPVENSNFLAKGILIPYSNVTLHLEIKQEKMTTASMETLGMITVIQWPGAISTDLTLGE